MVSVLLVLLMKVDDFLDDRIPDASQPVAVQKVALFVAHAHQWRLLEKPNRPSLGRPCIMSHGKPIPNLFFGMMIDELKAFFVEQLPRKELGMVVWEVHFEEGLD